MNEAVTLAWSHPSIAAVLAPTAAVVTVVLVWWRLRTERTAAAVVAAITRGVAVALALVAAAGPSLVSHDAERGEVLVVDAGAWDAGAGDVDADDEAGSRARFAGADLVLRIPADASSATDALEVARGARRAGVPAVLELATDGRRGVGRTPDETARALRASPGLTPGLIRTERVRVEPGLAPAPRLEAPASATQGVGIVLTLDAAGIDFAGGTAVVRTPLASVDAALPVGPARLRLPALDLPAGTHLVTVETPGRLPAAIVLEVAGPPRVAVLLMDGDSHVELVERLRVQGLEVMALPEYLANVDTLAEVAVCVVGPGRGRLQAESLALRTRAGMGLLVTGGSGVDGLQRLRDSRLESLLPVVLPEPPKPKPEPPKVEPPPPPPPDEPDEPDVPDEDTPKPRLEEADKRALRVALLLCIDRSGSMAGAKLRLAQESAKAAMRSLSPEDRIGIIAFDEESTWIAPFQGAGEQFGVTRRIDGIEAGGGTNFYPALKIGYEAILREDCGVRHVILLTDGATRPAVFRDMVLEGTSNLVTLSTVAVGDGADTELLGFLAKWGRGRLHIASDPRRLPAIVTVDTREFVHVKRDKERERIDASGLPAPQTQPKKKKPDPAVGATPPKVPADPASVPQDPEGEPVPAPPAASTTARVRIVAPAPFLAGLPRGDWPEFTAVETVAERPGAHVPLRFVGPGSDLDDAPAVALGRAGLGRVAVVCADVVTAEAAPLWTWNAGGQFLAQLARSLVEPPPAGARAISVEFVESEDGSAFVRVPSRTDGVLRLDPLDAGESVRVRCEQRGGLALGALVALPTAGVYSGVFETAEGRELLAVGVSAGPRPAVDAGDFDTLADLSDAQVHDQPGSPAQGEPLERQRPLDAPFLLAAAGLLVAEALARRFARP